jgi:hypothetical protein
VLTLRWNSQNSGKVPQLGELERQDFVEPQRISVELLGFSYYEEFKKAREPTEPSHLTILQNMEVEALGS